MNRYPTFLAFGLMLALMTIPLPSNAGHPDLPEEVDVVAALAEDAIADRFAALAAEVNAVWAGTMVPAGDIDGDGRPDAYVTETGYLQADFVWTPASSGIAMVVDARDGTVYAARAVVHDDEGRFILQTFRDGHYFSQLIIDPAADDSVILKVHAREHRYVASPTWPVTIAPAGIEKGDAAVWAAPFDLGHVVFVTSGDLDRDGYSDATEMLAGSHPVNAASIPMDLDADGCHANQDGDDRDPGIGC